MNASGHGRDSRKSRDGDEEASGDNDPSVDDKLKDGSDEGEHDRDEYKIINVHVGARYDIEELEDHRDTQRGRKYLALWKGYTKRTWVYVSLMKRDGKSDVDPRFAIET
jgi:hypothetical protein